MNLNEIRPRVARLRQFALGFAAEVQRWKGEEHLLLPAEKRIDLNGIQDALAGVYDAQVALEKAIQRLEDTFGPDGPTV
jgi:hypothetical protein